MIIRSKAPLRLGLAGGGTDVSPYCDMYGGTVLNATINLYAYTVIEETDDARITIQSNDNDCCQSFDLTRELPLDGQASLIKGTYNRLMKDFDLPLRPFKITTYNDAPAGSGLGTSSTMVVSLLKAFIEWHSLPLGDYETARLAYEIERRDLRLSGGRQDQYAASFGGFNFMEFHQDDRVIVNPLKVKRWIVDELESSLVLYYTGQSRSSAAIIDEQMRSASKGSGAPVEAMHRLKESATLMKHAILNGDIQAFASILGQSWDAKKQMADAISNPVIEEAFAVAKAAGAISGKVSGAGGGGFIMFCVDPCNKKSVEEALSKLEGFTLPFSFTEGGAHGWKIY